MKPEHIAQIREGLWQAENVWRMLQNTHLSYRQWVVIARQVQTWNKQAPKLTRRAYQRRMNQLNKGL